MIYFLHAPELGRIKIGYSCNVDSRLLRIRDGSPTRLALLATAPGGRDVELRLHKKFRGSRVFMEWFVEHAELVALCDAIKSAPEADRADIIASSIGVSNVSSIEWNKLAEKEAFSTALADFIDRHGSETFCSVAKLSPEMERFVRLHGAVIGPVPFTRLLAFDPLPFLAFWPFPETDLRRARREIDAQISRIEARKAAA